MELVNPTSEGAPQDWHGEWHIIFPERKGARMTPIIGKKAECAFCPQKTWRAAMCLVCGTVAHKMTGSDAFCVVRGLA